MNGQNIEHIIEHIATTTNHPKKKRINPLRIDSFQ